MGFFRRKSRNADSDRVRGGTPIDPEDYALAVGEGTHPGLPLDGKYWLVRTDTYYDNETRMLWEKAATRREAKRALNEFKRYCGMQPERLSQLHHDDVDGVWGAQPRDQPYAALVITHPKNIGALGFARDLRRAMGFSSEI